MLALVGHRFPGGTRTVEHWENWLLTDCTCRAPLADGALHPVVLFHLPIQAVGTSIGELFELCGADASPGSVTLLGYDWEYLAPMYEAVAYRADGSVVDVARTDDAGGRGAHDDVAFSIELSGPDGRLVARVTNRWRFRRSGGAAHADSPVVGQGTPIVPLVIDRVDAGRMKTMAALLRDPYPIHWDPDAVRAAGYGDRPVNQGPLNLAYVANMLMANFGERSLRRLTVRFHGRVFAGDAVIAGGVLQPAANGEEQRTVAVWLDRERDGGLHRDDVSTALERVVSGTAEVRPTRGAARP